MAVRGKTRRGGGGRRRIQSKNEESDASDDDYNVEEDGEFEDSDEYCSSLAGEEIDDDLVRGTTRLKRRKSFPSKSRRRVGKASNKRKRKVSYEEISDEDFVVDDDEIDEEENVTDWATGFPRRKRNGVKKASEQNKASYMEEKNENEAEDNNGDDLTNGVQKAIKENKSTYMEESDDDDDYEGEEDVVDDDEDYNAIEDEKAMRKGCPSRKQNRVRKSLKKKKASYSEESDNNNQAEDDLSDDEEEDDGIEDEQDSRKGCPGYKQSRFRNTFKEKKASYIEESDDNYEVEDDECDEDDGYEGIKDEKDLRKNCPGIKQNGVKKTRKKRKTSYVEESDDNYKVEDDACDEDDNYEGMKDEKDLRKSCPGMKENGVKKARKKRMASYTEESDDSYEAEDDEDEDDDYNDNEDEKDVVKKKASCTEDDDSDHEAEVGCDEVNDSYDDEDEKDLQGGSQSMKHHPVKKSLRGKKDSCPENDDDDYKAKDDECNDDDDYEFGEEEELEEEEDDEDFILNEIDFDDEDDIEVVEKAKKVKRALSQGRRSGGRKRRSYSKVKSKSKESTKRRGFQRKSSSGRRKGVKKRKSSANEINESNSGCKRRRLLVDSDSDFVDSKPLLLDQEYTISEEEREQVREATRFCRHLDVPLRKCSSNKRSEEEENLHQERKNKARKGKDKLEGLKVEVAKQVCGICFSEEGKRTVRGKLDCCSHYFCFNCIMEWSKVESRCPLCKQRFATLSKPGTEVMIPERDQVYQPSEEEIRSYIDPYENVICTECNHGGDDANMLLCDLCDSPAHTYCVGLSEVPEGNWYCEGCRPTALGPSNPQTPNSTRDRRTTNDLFARSSSPSENIRETIDLNRVYEPETPLVEVTGMSPSPRPVIGDLRAGSSALGAGVQTVRERRRRHQQIAHFVGTTGANIGLGPEVEWGRTRRVVSQNAIRTETSSFYNNFSQGLLQNSFTPPLPNMHLMSAAPSHSRVYQAWGQSSTGVNDPADGTGLLPPRLSGFRGGDGMPFHGNYPMQ